MEHGADEQDRSERVGHVEHVLRQRHHVGLEEHVDDVPDEHRRPRPEEQAVRQRAALPGVEREPRNHRDDEHRQWRIAREKEPHGQGRLLVEQRGVDEEDPGECHRGERGDDAVEHPVDIAGSPAADVRQAEDADADDHVTRQRDEIRHGRPIRGEIAEGAERLADTAAHEEHDQRDSDDHPRPARGGPIAPKADNGGRDRPRAEDQERGVGERTEQPERERQRRTRPRRP